jgi:hypothetical protein
MGDGKTEIARWPDKGCIAVVIKAHMPYKGAHILDRSGHAILNGDSAIFFTTLLRLPPSINYIIVQYGLPAGVYL